MTELAKLIEINGTSIRRLANDSGIPERTVYHHVRGETQMSLSQAAAYARALKCRVDDLLGDPEEAA